MHVLGLRLDPVEMWMYFDNLYLEITWQHLTQYVYLTQKKQIVALIRLKLDN